jgi:hypothetical protein
MKKNLKEYKENLRKGRYTRGIIGEESWQTT